MRVLPNASSPTLFTTKHWHEKSTKTPEEEEEEESSVHGEDAKSRRMNKWTDFGLSNRRDLSNQLIARMQKIEVHRPESNCRWVEATTLKLARVLMIIQYLPLRGDVYFVDQMDLINTTGNVIKSVDLKTAVPRLSRRLLRHSLRLP